MTAKFLLITFKQLCVMKVKLWYVLIVASSLLSSCIFRFDVTKQSFNWSVIKAKRDAYVKRLNGIYSNNLNNDGIEHLNGWGKIEGKGKGQWADPYNCFFVVPLGQVSS